MIMIMIMMLCAFESHIAISFNVAHFKKQTTGLTSEIVLAHFKKQTTGLTSEIVQHSEFISTGVSQKYSCLPNYQTIDFCSMV